MKLLSSPAQHSTELPESLSELASLTVSGRREFLKSAIALTVAARAMADEQQPVPVQGEVAPKARKHALEITDFNDYLPGQERPGSLRHALLTAVPDTCVSFSRPGTIELLCPLYIDTDGISISGEKNPLVIIGDTVGVRASDVELRHLWLFAGDAPAGERRPGKESHSKGGERDALVLLGSDTEGGRAIHSISIQHCWIGFGIDECFSTYGAVDHVVINRCMIGYGLNRSIHPKDKDRIDVPGHGKGVLIGTGAADITFTENLLVHNFDRNIVVRGGTQDIRFIGNTIYNWGRGNVFAAGDSGSGVKPSSGVFSDNTYLMGTNSLPGSVIFKPQSPETEKHFLVSGNRGPISMKEPVAVSGTSTSDRAAQAFVQVMKGAGPHPGLNDRLSLLACSQVQERSGEVIDYLTMKQNPEAKVGLGFNPTLEQLVTSQQLRGYLAKPTLSR